MERFFNHIQLGYMGLLPFLFFVAWQLFLGATELAISMFTYYSMAILAFMAGTLWRAGEQKPFTAWLSVIVTIPFPLLALASPSFILAYLAIGFWVVLLFEKTTEPWQQYSPDYRKMRFVLTSVVFVCHLFQFAMYESLTTLS
ncbi:putative membrane protein [Pseudoalteromonas luteoviolacea B = ATCC 29581]|nr:putative membrane protein [Pseudoalteromonas luteoviolacea B = ATCC 29581]